MTDLVIRNVEVSGQPGLDVRIRDGRIVEIGPRLAKAPWELNGEGGALIPGLVDHHLHILALAADTHSVKLARVRGPDEVKARIAQAARGRPTGAWIRATGYHETIAGPLSLADLDSLAPANPLRIQHQTGALWMLNSRALAGISQGETPACVERDPAGAPTGRVWRGDAWLRTRLPPDPPPLAPIGWMMARYGVTGLTDASVTTDASATRLLAEAHRSGALPQRLVLMSGRPLVAPEDGAFAVGPHKILLDEHDLPDLDTVIAAIAQAHRQGRAVAAHCVTAAELAFTLAAFQSGGARPGDRIEHGGVIPEDAIGQIMGLGLTVVTQPAFIAGRGDRYLAEVEAGEQDDLYRCRTLIEAGVAVAASSDAPYGDPDPWAAIRAATTRRTCGGAVLGERERVSPQTALRLYLDAQNEPGGAPRQVAVGAPADLCLLKIPLREALANPCRDVVAATLIDGRLAYHHGHEPGHTAC